mgnify:FL=1
MHKKNTSKDCDGRDINNNDDNNNNDNNNNKRNIFMNQLMSISLLCPKRIFNMEKMGQNTRKLKSIDSFGGSAFKIV